MIWFWTIFTGLIIFWYIMVTILVGVKGAQDIRRILRTVQMDNEKDGK